jgi:hypothetical protein
MAITKSELKKCPAHSSWAPFYSGMIRRWRSFLFCRVPNKSNKNIRFPHATAGFNFLSASSLSFYKKDTIFATLLTKGVLYPFQKAKTVRLF